MTMRKQPFGVSVLALLAIFGALPAIWHALQYLHVLPISIETVLGTVRFYGFDFAAALLWGLLAAIYLWVFSKLWAVDVQGVALRHRAVLAQPDAVRPGGRRPVDLPGDAPVVRRQRRDPDLLFATGDEGCLRDAGFWSADRVSAP